MKNVVEKIASENNITKKLAGELVASIIEGIKAEILSGEKLRISGFGTFTIKERAARTARNPQTGGEVKVPAKNVVTFKPATDFKEAVNG